MAYMSVFFCNFAFMKPRIIIDANIPYIRGAFDDVAEVEYLVAKDITHDKAMNADALIVRTRTQCNAALLEGSCVKMIATATIGIDHIDTEYCDTHNIQWTNAPGCNAESVAQWVGSALAVWANEHNCSLVGKTIGIVGHGHVGKRVERLAHKLGMNVLLNDPPLALENPDKYVDLHTIARECDVITFHTPLTREGKFATHHLADEEFFMLMPPGAIFINAARGEVINEDALIAASPKLGAVVIDTWCNEPNINEDLLEITDIATPHIAGYSYQGKENATIMAVRAVARYMGFKALRYYRPRFDEEGHEPVKLDLKGKNHGEIAAVFQYNYPIFTDDFRLRMNLAGFEKLRAEYQYRREIVYVDNNL